MKRRLISLASALVLSLTSFASLSVSADVATVPTIKAEIFDSEGNLINDASTLKVGDTFDVRYSYEGFNDLTAYVAGRTKTGTVLNAVQFMANVPCDDENLYWESWTSSDLTNAGAAQVNEDYDNGRLVYSAAFSDPAKAPSNPSGVLGNITVTVKAPITQDWTFDFDKSYDTSIFVNKIVKGVDNVTLYKAGAATNNIVFAPAVLSAGSKDVKVTGVTIKDKADFTLDLNGDTTKTLEAIVAPENATNKAVTWTSSKESVATVVDGKVTAVAKGEAVITVTTADGNFTDSVKVTVEDSTPVILPIIIVEDVEDMVVGEKIKLSVSNDQKAELAYKYESSSEDVATVDEDGTVTAVGIGNAKITVSAEGAEAFELTITVRKATVGDEITSSDSKKIKVFKMQDVNFDNHGYFIYITKGDETRKSAQTIGEILGGEWVEDAGVKATIAIGLITDSALDAFSFEVK